MAVVDKNYEIFGGWRERERERGRCLWLERERALTCGGEGGGGGWRASERVRGVIAVEERQRREKKEKGLPAVVGS